MDAILAHLTFHVLAVTTAAMLAGGVLKGTTGFGLPFITVPILTLAMDVPEAMAVSLFPILLSNVYQLFRDPAATRAAVVRFWPLVLSLVVMLALTSRLLSVIDTRVLMMLVGAAALSFVIFTLATPRLRVQPRHERWLAPLMGAISGTIGGFTSFYGTLAVGFVTALRLDKEAFVTTASLILLSGGVTLTVTLNRMGFFVAEQAVLSAIALVPLYVGMRIGQGLRGRLSQETFARIILALLALVGGSMILRGAVALL
ncbi:MAG: sulfite exporter TauE/SafE family protein [Hyphomicrobiales bacterium]|nr:sulfite exporter TauE/SafE family protein [Hyphomicrobiales bacterium]MCP5370216.1 sulfite exporter TauE/SafE family protein [Hyphomicrobiales bacterium]